jgi:protein TonB
VVNADGTVSNICVLKGVEHSLDQEALRIFASMPAWKPGKIDGIPVPVRVIWPVPFRK